MGEFLLETVARIEKIEIETLLFELSSIRIHFT